MVLAFEYFDNNNNKKNIETILNSIKSMFVL